MEPYTVAMELLRPVEASRELGISYPTLKQWIYRGRIKSIRTPGGHHRIPQSEIDRLLGVPEASQTRKTRPSPPAISGRNQLRGTVVNVRYEGLLAEVQIDVNGQVVTSIITRSAAEELRLRRGVKAAALIKATEVMVIRN
jgi:molybdopterin-binding protein